MRMEPNAFDLPLLAVGQTKSLLALPSRLIDFVVQRTYSRLIADGFNSIRLDFQRGRQILSRAETIDKIQESFITLASYK